MIGIDTNILVRYMTQDDVKQSKIATDYIEKYTLNGETLFINNLVICELVWVLKKCFSSSKENILLVINTILETSQFQIENIQIIWRAMHDYKKGNADFADYVVARTNLYHKCGTTITFDKKASNSKGFTLI